MKSTVTSASLLRMSAAVALAASVTGCRLAEGIFKAGVWIGIIAVVVLVIAIGGVAAIFKR